MFKCCVVDHLPCRCFNPDAYNFALETGVYYDAAIHAANMVHPNPSDKDARVYEAIQHAVDSRSVVNLQRMLASPTLRRFIKGRQVAIIRIAIACKSRNRRRLPGAVCIA